MQLYTAITKGLEEDSKLINERNDAEAFQMKIDGRLALANDELEQAIQALEKAKAYYEKRQEANKKSKDSPWQVKSCEELLRQARNR